MAISLDTVMTREGYVCTYADDNAPAGLLRKMPRGWMAEPILGTRHFFLSIDAAEYFILAMAIEAREIKVQGYDTELEQALRNGV